MSDIRTLPELTRFLKNADGIFSLILTPDGEENGIVLFAVDRARSMPLYYDAEGTVLSDSGEQVRQALKIETGDISVAQGIEMSVSRYVSGEQTIYKRVRQLNGGMAGCFSEGGVQTETYYFHTATCRTGDVSEYKRRLSEASESVFRRLRKIVDGRPVILSLSGGYDSRFIACMLKRYGFQDVSCYSYGKRDSFEAAQSKKNADALGYRWAFVEYTDERIRDILSEEDSPYFAYRNAHDYTIYLQNYPAVKYLNASGWFKPDSVFITGLCGDMPTGQYILPPDKMEDSMYCADACAEYLYGLEYGSRAVAAPYAKQLLQKIRRRIESLPFTVGDYQTFWQAADCIYTLDVHSRAFLHMNDAHEFFGYQWLLPYWDAELLNAWYGIPAQLRAGQKLYRDWLLNDVCKPYGLDTPKTIAQYSRSPALNRMIRSAGSVVAKGMLWTGLPLRRSVDINNFATLEIPLFRRLRYRGKIDYRHASFIQLLNRYVMESRYGVGAMREICRFLK